jgi:hypothetical protein
MPSYKRVHFVTRDIDEGQRQAAEAELVHSLQARILGYWATAGDLQTFVGTHAPSGRNRQAAASCQPGSGTTWRILE